MIIVSDTTPISELTKAGHLELLHSLFIQVVVPKEVYDELLRGNHPATSVVPTLDWLEIRTVTNTDKVQALQQTSNLDLGESAAIVLAEELQNAQLLIDEKAARKVAMARQLPIIGTLGVLLLAKQDGSIESVKPILDLLINQGSRISVALYTQVLMSAGEFGS